MYIDGQYAPQPPLANPQQPQPSPYPGQPQPVPINQYYPAAPRPMYPPQPQQQQSSVSWLDFSNTLPPQSTSSPFNPLSWVNSRLIVTTFPFLVFKLVYVQTSLAKLHHYVGYRKQLPKCIRGIYTAGLN